MQKYSSDPKVQYEKRPRGLQGEAGEIELEFWPSFSTKIIAFHLDKIPKVFQRYRNSTLNVKSYYSMEELGFWSVCLWMLSYYLLSVFMVQTSITLSLEVGRNGNGSERVRKCFWQSSAATGQRTRALAAFCVFLQWWSCDATREEKEFYWHRALRCIHENTHQHPSGHH